jgi:hypothetical protein
VGGSKVESYDAGGGTALKVEWGAGERNEKSGMLQTAIKTQILGVC